MSKHTSPTFETKEFTDQDLMVQSHYEDSSLIQATIIVRWKLHITFDSLGVWAMTPEINWVQVIANFSPDEQPDDPQLQIEGHEQQYNFTPETKGWKVKVETQKASNNEYRCTCAYVDVDDMVATIVFE